jgi:hypothetical protein
MASTADCKRFLEDYFSRNQALIVKILGETADTRQKNWKRYSKCSPEKSEYSVSDEYMIYGENAMLSHYGETSTYEPVSNFVSERAFFCTPTEGAIAFLVLERPDGTLALGDYIGD